MRDVCDRVLQAPKEIRSLTAFDEDHNVTESSRPPVMRPNMVIQREAAKPTWK